VRRPSRARQLAATITRLRRSQPIVSTEKRAVPRMGSADRPPIKVYHATKWRSICGIRSRAGSGVGALLIDVHRDCILRASDRRHRRAFERSPMRYCDSSVDNGERKLAIALVPRRCPTIRLPHYTLYEHLCKVADDKTLLGRNVMWRSARGMAKQISLETPGPGESHHVRGWI